MRFRKFILQEGFANFGFDNEIAKTAAFRSPNVPKNLSNDTPPIKQFDLEYLTDLVSQYSLGERHPKKQFIDQIVWGEGEGAIRLRFGTSHYFIVMERQYFDLNGDSIWITKNVFNLNSDEYANKEVVVAHEIADQLGMVNESPTESPINNFTEFKELVERVARRVCVVVNDPLFYEGIKKVSDNNYMILFGVKGHGVEGPIHSRVEQVMIDMHYDSKSGVVKAFQGNVESTLGQHSWTLVPSDWEFNFLPSQSRDEIVKSISTIMKYF